MSGRKCILTLFVFLFSTYLLAEDQFFNALFLDGNKNYVEVQHDDILNLGSEYTIEFWMYDNGGAPATIISKWYVADPIHITDDIWVVYHQGWFVEINERVPLFTPGMIPSPGSGNNPFDDFELYPGALQFTVAHIHLEEESIGGGTGAGVKLNAIETNKWIHIAITVNRDLLKSHFYINGESCVPGWAPAFEKDYNTPGYPLNIGGFPVTIDSIRYLNGLLDEIRIWNVERNVSQIQFCMNGPLSEAYCLTPDSGLVLYYRFDELENLGVGEDDLVDDIRDLSYYENHGDVIGNANLAIADIIMHVDPEPVDVPVAFDLLQNHPNPFNASTTIRFELSQKSPVRLSIYNVLGEEIETLIDDVMDQGIHDIVWNAERYSSGIYFSRLQTEGYVETVKMLLQQ